MNPWNCLPTEAINTKTLLQFKIKLDIKHVKDATFLKSATPSSLVEKGWGFVASPDLGPTEEPITSLTLSCTHLHYCYTASHA